MKKWIVISLALLIAGNGHAFDGQIEFATSKDGIEHSIRLSNWQAAGPSFDYAYSHKGRNCSFAAQGKLAAVLDAKGKPTQETWLDDDGKPIGRSMIFSGDNESINFPAKKNELLKFFGFGIQLPKDVASRGCLKNVKDIDLLFRNGHQSK